jgi:hypothetical protein
MSSFHRRRFSRFRGRRRRRKKKTQEIKYKENEEAFFPLFFGLSARRMMYGFLLFVPVFRVANKP